MAKTGKCSCGATLKLPDFANDSHAVCRTCGEQVELAGNGPPAKRQRTNVEPAPVPNQSTASVKYEPPESILSDVLTFSFSWVQIAVTLLYVIGYLSVYGSAVLIPLSVMALVTSESVRPEYFILFLFCLTVPVTGILINATAELMSALSRFLSAHRS